MRKVTLQGTCRWSCPNSLPGRKSRNEGKRIDPLRKITLQGTCRWSCPNSLPGRKSRNEGKRIALTSLVRRGAPLTLAPQISPSREPRAYSAGLFFGQAQREIGQSFWIAVTEADYSNSRPRTFVTRGCSRDGWRGRLGSRSARSARLSHASAMLSSRVLLSMAAALPAMSRASAANCRYSSCLLMMRLEPHIFENPTLARNILPRVSRSKRILEN